MPQKTAHECPSCKLNVTKTQYSVGCGSCGTYYHTDCAEISLDMLSVIKKDPTKFICANCKLEPTMSNCNNGDILRKMDDISKSIESKMDASKNDIERRMDYGFKNLDSKFDQLIKDLRTEVSNEIEKVKSDVTNCVSLVKKAEVSNDMKYQQLVAKNNMLERRLNRADILISGLKCSVTDVHEIMKKIAELVGVVINSSDICHCCFVKRRKQFLVKFNSVQLRDEIMKHYYKKPLLLCDVVGGTIESRVYLNDNLSPASSKLWNICRKLLKAKKIKNFRIINMDMPKANILKLDGKSELWDVKQCLSVLEEDNSGTSSN